MIDVSFGELMGFDVAPMSFAADAFQASTERRRKPKGEKVLRAVRPNVGIAAEYRRRLDAMIDEMANSVQYWLRASYRANEPATIALDESNADALRRSIRDLAKRWNRKFAGMGDRLAEYFAQSVEKRSTATLKKILKDGGWAVDFDITPAMQDILSATVHENVALIKSIPSQYFTQVEGIVYRSVQTGRDAGQLSRDLQTQLGVTKRRAALIARDQNEKATAAFTRARQLEVGITEAIWVHPAGGKVPRPSHVKAGRDKVRYSIAEGWLDPATGKRIWPGTEINCRCHSAPIVKGFA